jgi:hypothetical protein
LETHLVPRTPPVANFIARVLEKFPSFETEMLVQQNTVAPGTILDPVATTSKSQSK